MAVEAGIVMRDFNLWEWFITQDVLLLLLARDMKVVQYAGCLVTPVGTRVMAFVAL